MSSNVAGGTMGVPINRLVTAAATAASESKKAGEAAAATAAEEAARLEKIKNFIDSFGQSKLASPGRDLLTGKTQNQLLQNINSGVKNGISG